MEQDTVQFIGKKTNFYREPVENKQYAEQGDDLYDSKHFCSSIKVVTCRKYKTKVCSRQATRQELFVRRMNLWFQGNTQYSFRKCRRIPTIKTRNRETTTMNNKNFRISRRVLLPLLFCSAAVLAGDGGLSAPFGQVPPPNALTLEDDQAPDVTCDSGDPSRGDCPPVAIADNADMAAAPDTMQQAQQLGNEQDGFVDNAQETGMPGVNTGYVGGRTRVGIGIDSEFKTKADATQVFSETEDSAVIGQGYIGIDPKKGETGYVTGAGAKVNYHWVSKDGNGQASHVNKVFGAYDQNGKADKDGKQAKKLTVGYGQENEKMFWSGSVMKGLSDKVDTGQKDANGSTIFEKAYDWGLGGRVGTYLSEQQMRIQGGLDYEWGKEHAANESKAKQVTLTGGLEKFFPDSPHSINANLDVYKKSGGYVEGDQKAKVRGGVGYRYDIASGEAGVWQADKMYRRVRTEIPGEAVKTPPKVERKLVKHTMELEADTFFKLDSAKLTPEAQERMKSVIAQMRESGHEGNIRITGNTCDIGSDAHNQKLSERRANAVRDFLVKNGFSADELLAQGLGESSPKYPNTNTERHKNRRVDIEFVTYQNEYKDQVVEEGGTSSTDPKVVWKQELIPTPPLWVRQALHNVADHKQRVDTYKTTAGGECTAVAAAADDTDYTADQDSTGNVFSVLDNDTACDKQGLTIIDVQNPSDHGGTVTISGDGKTVIYAPQAGFTGTDTFTYTIKDTKGKTSTATVTVKVNATGGSCTVPTANDDGAYTIALNGTDAERSIDVLLNNDESCSGDLSKLTIDEVTCDVGNGQEQAGLSLDGSLRTVLFDSTHFSSHIGETLSCEYIVKDEDGKLSANPGHFTVNISGSCPSDVAANIVDASYTYNQLAVQPFDAPYAGGINAADFLPSGVTEDQIEYVSFDKDSNVSSTDFLSSTGMDDGNLYIDGHMVKFESDLQEYCSNSFNFYVKLKCGAVVTVPVNLTGHS
jgi:outer membrane protein OmpA-like peptidoglycan-associated protein